MGSKGQPLPQRGLAFTSPPPPFFPPRPLTIYPGIRGETAAPSLLRSTPPGRWLVVVDTLILFLSSAFRVPQPPPTAGVIRLTRHASYLPVSTDVSLCQMVTRPASRPCHFPLACVSAVYLWYESLIASPDTIRIPSPRRGMMLSLLSLLLLYVLGSAPTAVDTLAVGIVVACVIAGSGGTLPTLR